MLNFGYSKVYMGKIKEKFMEEILDLSDKVSGDIYEIKCLTKCFENLFFETAIHKGESDYLLPLATIISQEACTLSADYEKVEKFVYNI